MPLRTSVKVGNITNLSDARYCAGMGVEMLGFNAVEGTSGYISPKAFQEIRGWLSGPMVVAEIYGITKEMISVVRENYQPDLLELSIKELSLIPVDLATGLLLSIDKESYTNNKTLVEKLKHKIRYVIIARASEAQAFIREIGPAFNVLVAPGNDTRIGDLLDDSCIKGITLHGSQEIKPGLKDYDHLASILEELDVD